MFSIILAFILSLFRDIVWACLLLILIILWFTYMTKPSNESFDAFMQYELNKTTGSQISSKYIRKQCDKHVRDFVIFKVINLRNRHDKNKQDIIFLGIFQTWTSI